MVVVTAFFAGLLALMFAALSLYVIIGRYKYKVALGDGGNAEFSRRIRAQANFAEYVPIALVLMALAELNGASHQVLHIAGWALIAARMSHAYSLVSHEPRHKKIIFRQIGMVTTLSIIILLALMVM